MIDNRPASGAQSKVPAFGVSPTHPCMGGMTLIFWTFVVVVVALLAIGLWAERSRRRHGATGSVDSTHNPQERGISGRLYWVCPYFLGTQGPNR
jgi:cytochrome c-type biogenesis protein CcmH/NrfF